MAKTTSKSLFIDTLSTQKRGKVYPTWTLRTEDWTAPDGHLYKSAYQAYMNASTEYEAAMEICHGDYTLWENLCGLAWFTEFKHNTCPRHLGLDYWRKEKKLRDLAEQIKNLKTIAKEGNVQASKEIIRLLNEADKLKGAGRPKKNTSKPQSKEDSMIADFIAAKERLQNK